MTPMTNAEIAAIDARYAAGETVWMWCVHHEVLCEPLTEPLSNRIAYINTMKAAAERPRRLEELRPVLHPERLPVAWREAYRACQEADRALRGARRSALPELESLHREEYPDSAWDGHSIFGGVR